ncbi:MFS transporter [Gordonia sp. NPDC003376]
MTEDLREIGSASASSDGPDNRVIVVVATAALMAVVDGTIVSASLMSIAADLGSTIEVAAWFTAAYLVAAGITMPLSGWVVDRVGARRTLLAALTLFVIGSVLCGFATGAGQLVAFRLFQGFGGGLLEPTALTIAATAAGPARMGRVMGAVSGVINVAPVLGPLAGGALSGAGHWEWIFWINVPLGLAVLVGAVVLIDPDTPVHDDVQRPDLVGMVLLPSGFAALLLGVERVADDIAMVLLVAAGALGLAAYAVRALRTSRPSVLDLRLLAIPGFRAGLGAMAGVGFLMYFQLVGLALLAQQRYGLHSLGAGLLVSVLGVGILISMTASGSGSDRIGARVIVTTAASTAALIATGIALVMVLSDPPVAVVAAGVFVFGLSFGAVAAPSFTSVYRTVPAERIGHATPSLFVTVQLCAAAGAATAAALVTRIGATEAVAVGYGLGAVLMGLAASLARRLPGRR